MTVVIYGNEGKAQDAFLSGLREKGYRAESRNQNFFTVADTTTSPKADFVLVQGYRAQQKRIVELYKEKNIPVLIYEMPFLRHPGNNWGHFSHLYIGVNSLFDFPDEALSDRFESLGFEIIPQQYEDVIEEIEEEVPVTEEVPVADTSAEETPEDTLSGGTATGSTSTRRRRTTRKTATKTVTRTTMKKVKKKVTKKVLKKRTGPVLVIGQYENDAQHDMNAEQLREAYTEIYCELKKRTHEKIIFRSHPTSRENPPKGYDGYDTAQETPENVAIDNASAVVTLNSSMGFKAILRGVPTYCGKEGFYTEAAAELKDFGRKDHVIDPDKVKKICNRIAYSQWTPEEIAAGLPFEYLKENGRI